MHLDSETRSLTRENITNGVVGIMAGNGGDGQLAQMNCSCQVAKDAILDMRYHHRLAGWLEAPQGREVDGIIDILTQISISLILVL
ncbi:hypothetical protein VMCG_05114 [Cytospora schulzeri]|uniref:Uncharacterized protein n=1 Tax=Cytospora schulzeri TaxID=448051 RepID=A0A423WMA3_9PEZI|nr:hypothetical protein VMCG_05114 [Valsa malicola]